MYGLESPGVSVARRGGGGGGGVGGEWRWCDGKKGKNTEQLFLETDNPFISNIFLSFESSIQRSLDIETKSFPGFSITRPFGTREREREEKEKILGTRFNIRAYAQLIKCVTSLLLSPVCFSF